MDLPESLTRAERERALKADRAYEASGLRQALAALDPLPVDTVRIGLDLPGSDLDVVCGYRSRAELLAAIAVPFATWHTASLHVHGEVVIVRTRVGGFALELYATPGTSETQLAARHFHVMRRLVELGGAPFREAVRERKRRGAKTEPAIAAMLRLEGDPYEAVAALREASDARLHHLLVRGARAG